jgi:hypothetical protein
MTDNVAAANDRGLERTLGFALWKVEAVRAGRKPDPAQPREAVRAAWKAESKAYMRSAALLVRQLKAHGYVITPVPGADSTEETA